MRGDNGVITQINVEEGRGVDASSAETMMALLWEPLSVATVTRGREQQTIQLM